MMYLGKIFDLFKGKAGKDEKVASGPNVAITNINLKLGVDVHSLPGMEPKEQVFNLPIPFQNKLGKGLLPDNLKGPPITVSLITVEKPFELVDIAPKPPVEVDYLSKKMFDLRIRAPNANYTGPLTIKFDTESKDNIDLNIQKMVLIDSTKTFDVEESAINMRIKKSQIFKRDIQLYKILSYGRKLESIEVNAPFELSSTEPKLPLLLDKEDSYVVTLFIKCPDFNYVGPLEIKFR